MKAQFKNSWEGPMKLAAEIRRKGRNGWQWLDNNLLDRTGERRARAALDEQSRKATVAIKKARKERKSGWEFYVAEEKAYFEVRLANERLAELVTQRLLREAWRRNIPIPQRPQRSEESEYWYMGDEGDWILTDAGISQIRAGIRADRFSQWQLPLAVGSLVIGILGSVAGYLGTYCRLGKLIAWLSWSLIPSEALPAPLL